MSVLHVMPTYLPTYLPSVPLLFVAWRAASVTINLRRDCCFQQHHHTL